jgi:hypothetical protein
MPRLTHDRGDAGVDDDGVPFPESILRLMRHLESEGEGAKDALAEPAQGDAWAGSAEGNGPEDTASWDQIALQAIARGETELAGELVEHVERRLRQAS